MHLKSVSCSGMYKITAIPLSLMKICADCGAMMEPSDGVLRSSKKARVEVVKVESRMGIVKTNVAAPFANDCAVPASAVKSMPGEAEPTKEQSTLAVSGDFQGISSDIRPCDTDSSCTRAALLDSTVGLLLTFYGL